VTGRKKDPEERLGFAKSQELRTKN